MINTVKYIIFIKWLLLSGGVMSSTVSPFFLTTVGKTVNYMEEEKWVDIPNYEGKYKISNFSRVKSLSKKDVIMTQYESNNGYVYVELRKNGVVNKRSLHKLLAQSFLGYKGYSIEKKVVNHIDFDRKNNSLDNLEIVTQRENSNLKHKHSASNFTGVSFSHGKAKANIYINKRLIGLGTYDTEEEANKAYELAVENVNLYNGDNANFKARLGLLNTNSTTLKGASYSDKMNKWMANISINGKTKYIGSYSTELKANTAFLIELKNKQDGV